MDLSNSGIKIDKLNDTNFHMWKQRIQLFLALKESDDYIIDDPPDSDSDEYRKLSGRPRFARLALRPYALAPRSLNYTLFLPGDSLFLSVSFSGVPSAFISAAFISQQLLYTTSSPS